MELKDVKAHSEKVNAIELFEEPNAVYLGFQRSGHAYIWASKARYDGQLWNQFAAKVNKDTPMVSEGLIIKIGGLSAEAIAKLKAKIESKKNAFDWHLSCLSGACSILKAGANIEWKKSVNPLRPALSFKSLIENGLIDSNQRDLPLTFYTINGASISDIHKTIGSRIYESALPFAILGIGSVAAPSVIHLDIKDHKKAHENQKQPPAIVKKNLPSE